MTTLLRSLLFVPGSSTRMIDKSFGVDADAVIYDLEDAVSPAEKDHARSLVVAALRRSPRTGPARWVRINGVGTRTQVDDVTAVVAAAPDVIVLPKADSATLSVLEAQLDELETDRPIRISALIETCRGLLDVEQMCLSSRRLVALQLGAEDLTKQIGVPRTPQGTEILAARSRLVIVGHAFGKHVIDTPNVNVHDEEALAADVARARALGMTGKPCIHPRQIATVNEAFSPSAEAIAEASRIVQAFDEALAQGKGASALDGQMIDAPIVERAKALLERAAAIESKSSKQITERG